MNSQWTIWTDTKDERKSRKLLDRVAKELKRTPTNVHAELDEGESAVHFEIPVCAQAWSDIVLELIQLGHAVADRWAVSPGTSSGSMYDAAEGYSTNLSLFRVAGVKFVHWYVENSKPPGTRSG